MCERKNSGETAEPNADAAAPIKNCDDAPSAEGLTGGHGTNDDDTAPVVQDGQPDQSSTEPAENYAPEYEPEGSDEAIAAEALATSLADLASTVREVGARFDMIAQQSKRVHEINGKLHAELQKLRENEVLAMLRPGFGGFVRLIGRIDSDIARWQKSDKTLGDQLMGYRIDLANALQDCGLIEEPPTDLEEPTRFSPAKQEVNIIVPTDDRELNQIIARIAQPAFFFQGRLMFPERVDVYRYTAPKEEKGDQ